MTLLHVACGLGPSIKNPGYAYDLSGYLKVETAARFATANVCLMTNQFTS